MSLFSIRNKINRLLNSPDEIPNDFREKLLRTLARKEMELMRFVDYFDMKRYLKRFTYFSVMYLLNGGKMTGKMRCEILLSTFRDWFLALREEFFDKEHHEDVFALCEELLKLDEIMINLIREARMGERLDKGKPPNEEKVMRYSSTWDENEYTISDYVQSQRYRRFRDLVEAVQAKVQYVSNHTLPAKEVYTRQHKKQKMDEGVATKDDEAASSPGVSKH